MPSPDPSRRGRGFWVPVIAIVLSAFGVAILGVVLAQQLRAVPEVQAFVERYPGESAPFPDAPVGFPAWLAWQHFLSAFLLVFLVRTGLQIRSRDRPPAFWTRRLWVRDGPRPRRLSIWVWFHLVLDILWAANGILYVVLLFATGQWMRLIPTGWDVVPHALSAAIQYASFDWPVYDGWVHYNALQLLLYAATVFIAAPLALVTGLRLSPAWNVAPYRRLARILPEKPIRTLHVIVMFYVIGFTIIHVALVLATGALRNLNHMYAVRDDDTWIGAAIFGASLAVTVVAWFVLRVPVLKRLAALSGEVR